MYIFIYIHMHIYIHIHTYIHMHTYIHTYLPTYLHTYIRYTHVITSRNFQFKQTWRLTMAIAEMKCDTEQTMNWEWLYKVGSECELISWPDSSAG